MARVTLRKLSEMTGVSKSTISRILNNYSEGFSCKPEVREKVLAAVKEHNYQQHPIYKTMKAQETNIISVLGYQIYSSPYSTIKSVLKTTVENLNQYDYKVITNFISNDVNDSYTPICQSDGVIIVDMINPECLAQLESSNTPYLSVNGICGPNGVSVMFDETKSTANLCSFLKNKGHKKIAYSFHSRGYNLNHYSCIERYAGYTDFCEREGLTSIFDKEVNGVALVNSVQRLIEDGVTAVVAYDETRARNILEALRYSDEKDKIELVSVTNTTDDCFLSLPITSWVNPSEEMGKLAADLLVEWIKSGQRPQVQKHLLCGKIEEYTGKLDRLKRLKDEE